MIEVREFWLDDGTAPFAGWFETLPAQTADRIDTALRRMRRKHEIKASQRLWKAYKETKRSKGRWH